MGRIRRFFPPIHWRCCHHPAGRPSKSTCLSPAPAPPRTGGAGSAPRGQPQPLRHNTRATCNVSKPHLAVTGSTTAATAASTATPAARQSSPRAVAQHGCRRPSEMPLSFAGSAVGRLLLGRNTDLCRQVCGHPAASKAGTAGTACATAALTNGGVGHPPERQHRQRRVGVVAWQGHHSHHEVSDDKGVAVQAEAHGERAAHKIGGCEVSRHGDELQEAQRAERARQAQQRRRWGLAQSLAAGAGAAILASAQRTCMHAAACIHNYMITTVCVVLLGCSAALTLTLAGPRPLQGNPARLQIN